MKKKLLFWSILSVLAVFAVGAGMVSCGDDNGGGGGGSSSNIVGEWTGEAGRHHFECVFFKDNTGILIDYYLYRNDSYSGPETDGATFTYTMAGATEGTIIFPSVDSYSGLGTRVYKFSLSNTTLSVYDSNGKTIVVMTKKGTLAKNENIVGTWQTSDEYAVRTFTFNAGGTGVYERRYLDSNYGSETRTLSFTYKMSDATHGRMTVKDEDSYSGVDYDDYSLVIVGDRLFVFEDVDDLEYVLTKVN